MAEPSEPRERILDDLSFLCARTIENFGDLTPMEVEAYIRSVRQEKRRAQAKVVTVTRDCPRCGYEAPCA